MDDMETPEGEDMDDTTEEEEPVETPEGEEDGTDG
jgi:hypothetical protein